MARSGARPGDWKLAPFEEGIPIPYAAEFSPAEFEKVRGGLLPEQMEDKWFIYFDRPYLYFHRSWTGQSVYRLKLEERGGGWVVVEALWSLDLARAEGSDPSYQADLVDFLISNLMLGQAKKFPTPRGLQEPMPGLYQHHISGTGYPPAQPRSKS